jgi:hypothetical protein
VERFGEKGETYLTVFNDSGRQTKVVITLTSSNLFNKKAFGEKGKVRELVGGTDLPVTDGKLTLSLKAEDVAIIALCLNPSEATNHGKIEVKDVQD